MREVEVKYGADPSFELPDLSGTLPGVASVSAPLDTVLRAEYFDSDDLRLARFGITLRRRTGGADDGWHLKLPADVGGRSGRRGPVAREELTYPLSESVEVPGELVDLVAVWLRGAPLVSVATLVTERRMRQLCDPAGRPLAEVTDDAVTVVNGDQLTGRFREIEVEDRGGGTAVLEAVGSALEAHGAVAGEFSPKVVRALGAAAAEAPDVAEPEPVRGDDPAAALVVATIRRHVRALMWQDPRVRQDLDDAVHQMRVAARRLRSALRTFRPLLDEEWTRALRGELQWLGSSLGEARDVEVLELRLVRAIDALPAELVHTGAEALVVEALDRRATDAKAAALATLGSQRYVTLIDRLVDAARKPMTTPSADEACRTALPSLVAVAWQRLDKAAARAHRRSATDADLHATRIAAKQARYATEAVVPVYGEKARNLAVRAQRVQDVLGEQHDAVVAAETVRQLAQEAGADEAGFTLGVLHERQLAEAEAARAAFVQLWPAMARRRHRGWLHA